MHATYEITQDRITFPLPDDFHAHLRQDSLLHTAVRGQVGQFRRVLAMPNTLPPIASAAQLSAYAREVEAALATYPVGMRFEPLFTFKILPGMQEADVEALKAAGAIAGKYYPAGQQPMPQTVRALSKRSMQYYTRWSALGSYSASMAKRQALPLWNASALFCHR